MQKLLISIIVSASIILSGCSSSWIPGVHRLDIQQGNVITQEMVDKLKPGMDKSQVRFALGTPSIVDVFHQDRWDYIYSIQPGGEQRQQRRLSVFFEDDRLVRIDGDVQASQGAREEAAPSKETTVTVNPTAKKKGFFGGLKSAIGLGDEDDFAPAPASASDNQEAETQTDEVQDSPDADLDAPQEPNADSATSSPATPAAPPAPP